MPKLNAKMRKKVDKAEAVSGEFELLKPGKYIGRLAGVEAKNSNAGNPMWVAEFDEIHDLDGERVPGRQWYNINLPIDGPMPEGYQPKNSKKSPEEAWATTQQLSEGRLKHFFEVFGYSTDSDTDEMIDERCVLQIGVRTIQNGPRTGEKTNSLNSIAPLDSVDYDADGDGTGTDPDDF